MQKGRGSSTWQQQLQQQQQQQQRRQQLCLLYISSKSGAAIGGHGPPIGLAQLVVDSADAAAAAGLPKKIKSQSAVHPPAHSHCPGRVGNTSSI